VKDQQDEKNILRQASADAKAMADRQDERVKVKPAGQQDQAAQEKPKKKRGRKPKSETQKVIEKKEVKKKLISEPEKTAVSVGQEVKEQRQSSYPSKTKVTQSLRNSGHSGGYGAQVGTQQGAVPASEGKEYTQARRPAYGQQDYRTNGSGRQNGGKSYNKAMERQQQEAKYMAFVKSIQDMPKEELRSFSLAELNNIARRLGMVGASLMTKDKLFNKILEVRDNPDTEEVVTGVLEKLPDGFGFLRSPRFDYISGPDDIYISPSQIRRFGLKTGDTVSGTIRKPKDGEKYFALLKVDKVNHKDPIHAGDRLNFDRLSPLHPDKKLALEHDSSIISTRLIDIFSPIGKGQRGLLVAPPKVGKTVLLKDIALSLQVNHPDVYLIVLLIDERPEEVTDMRRTIESENAEVISSTFDESANRHVQVAEIVLEKAKRMVEAGLDVVILLDSITRLARAYNTIAPASGKVLTGGIDANALQRPKKFFGAARYLEGAGSLTIIATALVDTGSKMDEVIYEEFKGTGNMEMHMTRKLSNRRIYPALDLLASGTRRDDLLQPEGFLNKVWILQRFLGTLNVIEGMEFLVDKMRKFKTNEEFMESINKK